MPIIHPSIHPSAAQCGSTQRDDLSFFNLLTSAAGTETEALDLMIGFVSKGPTGRVNDLIKTDAGESFTSCNGAIKSAEGRQLDSVHGAGTQVQRCQKSPLKLTEV